MKLHDDIIALVQSATRGMVTLGHAEAEKVIRLVKQYMDTPGAHAKLSRYNSVKNGWDLLRVARTTNEAIKQQIIIALESRPVDHCYMWECYNSEGLFEGKIFTIHTNLF